MTAPFAGQPGRGSTAFARNQPARIADGRFQAGSTVVLLQTPAVAESTEVGSTMAAVLAAYDQHLGLTTAWRRS
jgi:hypothetical protein